MNKKTYCVLSFDVEEWFQVENLRSAISKDMWSTLTSSVSKNTKRILAILKDYNIPGSFFVLGSVADKNTDLIKEIADSGNEIASHGYGHDLSYQLTKQELVADIQKSSEVLESLIGKKIVGYRAPNFSVSEHLIDILENLGFRYDSSYNPFRLNSRYGSLNIPDSGYDQVVKIRNNFYEIPVPTIKIMNQNIPIAGGAYFRLLPYPLFDYLVRRKIATSNFYSFYLHPWEFEPEQPRIKNIPLNYRVRHYTGLGRTEMKFRKFIESLLNQNCTFTTYEDYVQSLY